MLILMTSVEKYRMFNIDQCEPIAVLYEARGMDTSHSKQYYKNNFALTGYYCYDFFHKSNLEYEPLTAFVFDGCTE